MTPAAAKSAAFNGSAIKVPPHRRHKKRPHNTSTNPLSVLKGWLVKNQIRMPLGVLTALATVHVVIPQPYTAKFFSLSHFNPATQLFNKGSSDWLFVTTFVFLFTFLRAVLMRYIFSPIFYRCAPHPSLRTATRFAEQAWSVSYYSISFLIGLYIIMNSEYWKDIKEVWADYPQIETHGFFKAYYLVEMAFWLQQVFVLNIEARRKDFWQMFCHHLITCTLIFMSYTYNVTRVGNAILCVMDFSDILLSSAKMLKYLELQRLCDTTFFFFLISWPYTRHYLYNIILYSAYFDAPVIFHRDHHNRPTYQVNPPKGGGAWQPGCDWNPAEGYYFTKEVHLAFIFLLAILQAILLLWFAMIIRLAIRVIRGAHAEDDRSDDEDDENEEEGDVDENGSVRSPSVSNGIGGPPDNISTQTTSVTTVNDTIAFSNAIYQRKTEKGG